MVDVRIFTKAGFVLGFLHQVFKFVKNFVHIGLREVFDSFVFWFGSFGTKGANAEECWKMI